LISERIVVKTIKRFAELKYIDDTFVRLYKSSRVLTYSLKERLLSAPIDLSYSNTILTSSLLLRNFPNLRAILALLVTRARFAWAHFAVAAPR
jgi:hypothetical protein